MYRLRLALEVRGICHGQELGADSGRGARLHRGPDRALPVRLDRHVVRRHPRGVSLCLCPRDALHLLLLGAVLVPGLLAGRLRLWADAHWHGWGPRCSFFGQGGRLRQDQHHRLRHLPRRLVRHGLPSRPGLGVRPQVPRRGRRAARARAVEALRPQRGARPLPQGRAARRGRPRGVHGEGGLGRAEVLAHAVARRRLLRCGAGRLPDPLQPRRHGVQRLRGLPGRRPEERRDAHDLGDALVRQSPGGGEEQGLVCEPPRRHLRARDMRPVPGLGRCRCRAQLPR
mmetsp:Transcript_64466/g.180254  ORF Transcript_64466/g.180254 Transcript_64466/m.180254 type:complete len:285 (+) Transcript_64466:716-1570(+)